MYCKKCENPISDGRTLCDKCMAEDSLAALHKGKKKDGVRPLEFPAQHTTEESKQTQNNNTHTKNNVTVLTPVSIEQNAKLYETEGIIYEIAEELYLSETEKAKAEAILEPPFHKELTAAEQENIKQKINEVSSEQTSTPDTTIKTSGAFWFQFLMIIPLVNLISALIIGTKRKANPNYRAFARANLVWYLIGCITIVAITAIMLYSGIKIDFSNLYFWG